MTVTHENASKLGEVVLDLRLIDGEVEVAYKEDTRRFVVELIYRVEWRRLGCLNVTYYLEYNSGG